MEFNQPSAATEFLDGLAARPLVPSLVVHAGEAGKSEATFSFLAGFADRESERRPTIDTVYGLGSTSKTFVAVCVLRLVADGLVRLHDPIASVLPATKQLPVFDGVTIHHLLTHTSGLAPLDARYAALDRAAPSDFTGGADRPRPAQLALPAGTPGLGFVDHVGLIDYLGAFDLDPIAPPGRQFSYSNEGYVLLTGLVAEASNTPYETFCRTHVFEPLGLSRTAFIGSEEAASLDDVATPYKREGDSLIPVSWWDAPAWAGPGGVLSSARDLLRFAHAIQTKSVPGVPGDLLASMCAPHARRGSDGWYGYGLTGARIAGRLGMGHAGGRVGTSAEMVWLDEGPAAVGFVNLSGGPAVPAAHAALLGLVGENPNLATAPPPARPYLPLSAVDPARVVGDYAAAEGGAVRVTFDADAGQLFGHVGLGGDDDGPGIPIHPVSADTYEARFGGGAMTLPFLIDGVGPAWGVEFGGRVLTRSPHVRRRHPAKG